MKRTVNLDKLENSDDDLLMESLIRTVRELRRRSVKLKEESIDTNYEQKEDIAQRRIEKLTKVDNLLKFIFEEWPSDYGGIINLMIRNKWELIR